MHLSLVGVMKEDRDDERRRELRKQAKAALCIAWEAQTPTAWLKENRSLKRKGQAKETRFTRWNVETLLMVAHWCSVLMCLPEVNSQWKAILHEKETLP